MRIKLQRFTSNLYISFLTSLKHLRVIALSFLLFGHQRRSANSPDLQSTTFFGILIHHSPCDFKLLLIKKLLLLLNTPRGESSYWFLRLVVVVVAGGVEVIEIIYQSSVRVITGLNVTQNFEHVLPGICSCCSCLLFRGHLI